MNRRLAASDSSYVPTTPTVTAGGAKLWQPFLSSTVADVSDTFGLCSVRMFRTADVECLQFGSRINTAGPPEATRRARPSNHRMYWLTTTLLIRAH